VWRRNILVGLSWKAFITNKSLIIRMSVVALCLYYRPDIGFNIIYPAIILQTLNYYNGSVHHTYIHRLWHCLRACCVSSCHRVRCTSVVVSIILKVRPEWKFVLFSTKRRPHRPAFGSNKISYWLDTWYRPVTLINIINSPVQSVQYIHDYMIHDACS
jgi:hypothetical protein